MKRILCLLLALLLAFSLAACSAKNETGASTEEPAETEVPQTVTSEAIEVVEPEIEVSEEIVTPAELPMTPYYAGAETPKPSEEDSFAATYQITRIDTVSGEGSADETGMQSIRDRGYHTLLILNNDGTGVMDLLGEQTPFVYDDESGVITMNDQPSQMTLREDGTLVIQDAAGTMYLELLP